MKTHTLSKPKAEKPTPKPMGQIGGHTRDNDIRWTKDEWGEMARLGAMRIAKVGASVALGEILATVQKSALPSRRWRPLSELSNATAQTQFYKACDRMGIVIEERPPRVEGVKAVQPGIRWTEREMLLVLRRVLHLEKVSPDVSRTEAFSRAQNLELPEDRRYPGRHSLSTQATFWNDRWEPLKNNLWLLDKVPFYPDATTYEEAQGEAPKPKPEPVPEPTPQPDPAAFIAAQSAAALQMMSAALPPAPISPAMLSAPIVSPSGGVEGLASGIAGALNAYIADRDAAITAHVMQSIASGPLAGSIAAHIIHTLAPTIAQAVQTIVGQVVPGIVAAEIAQSVRHVSTATGPLQSPQPPKPEGEPPPEVIEVKAQEVAHEPAQVIEVAPKGPKPPKHNPEPRPTPGTFKKIRIDLVGTERQGVIRSVMGHLNGAGRYVDLHSISQNMTGYHPSKGTPVVFLDGFAGHDMKERIDSAGVDVYRCGKGALSAAKAIKRILTERGYLAA